MSEEHSKLVSHILEQCGGSLQSLALAEPQRGCLEVILSRPQVRNALDETMIKELTQVVFAATSRLDEEAFRLLHLCGSGSVFCAGADLDMMARLGAAPFDVNLDDARRLSRLFEVMASCPVPVIVSVQGAAIGGGFGLAVCADAVVTHSDAVFATTEVRLGLVPAVISPYIVRKVGVAAASLPLLSGRRIDGRSAELLGLAQIVVATPQEVQPAAQSLMVSLLGCAPQAQRETKRLLQAARPLPPAELRAETEATIARIRSAPEARYGLSCFLNKQTPDWSLSPHDRQEAASEKNGDIHER